MYRNGHLTSLSTRVINASVLAFLLTSLPAANEVCEGYVFTGVCLSTGGLSLCPGGSLPQGGLHPRASLSRGVSVRGISVQGVSVQGGGGALLEPSERPINVHHSCVTSIGRHRPFYDQNFQR